MLKELASGIAGAVALTAIHESARKTLSHAPRMDVIGTRAISRPLRAGRTPPRWNRLRNAALAGDVVANGLFYSLIGLTGLRRDVVSRGLLFGLVAGLGAVLLPPAIGLGRSPHRKTPLTELLTVAWYTLGGPATAGVLKAWWRATGEEK